MAPSHPERFRFILGTTIHKYADTFTQIRMAGEIHMHSNYNDVTLENDIALIRLETSVTYTDYVRPICLPQTSNETFESHIECYTSGWGGLDDQARDFPDRLQEAKMHLINDDVCAADSDIARYGLYEDIMLCAGYTHGHVTICSGDSGGPLVCRGRDNVWTLVGVVSWGPVTAFIDCMGISVYAQVTAYLDWIYSTSGIS